MDVIARGPGADTSASIWTGVFWLAAIIALAAFAYLIARQILDRRDAHRVPAAEPVAPARTILDERLARGEIEIDEYRERLTALET
ncbi:hypothetical protein [Demequina sp. NBRC 110056]|uniref:hypothetical protein n=1 Tax=Demequina sp. NBRC 110056 TaxID=1570345 RepID=UPI0009FFE679|nr:hypothetical protein [Demequina sp. NBRC 110056]